MSNMQLRLREEYDSTHTFLVLAYSQCDGVISYELYEYLTRGCCMSVEDVYEEMWEK